MLLAVDIGNTDIVIGISSDDDEWIHQWRIQADVRRSADEYRDELEGLAEGAGYALSEMRTAIISSVVPRLTPLFKAILEQETGSAVLVLDGTMDVGIQLNTEEPAAVGADLIADAVAAYDYFDDTCLVVDFGTATTIMAVKRPGELVGGAICAGLQVTSDALVERAAQLTDIPFDIPEKAVGRNTLEAMQSGLVLGHLCMVEGLVARMTDEVGPAGVIATGGLSGKMAPRTDCFDAVDPLLTLNGMRLIARRQQ